jgi:hypothetical protein
MALPNNNWQRSEAARLAERLRNNSGDDEELRLEPHNWAKTWTEAEIVAVSDAAEGNTAIRSLNIFVAELRTIDDANVVGRIVRHLHHVQKVVLSDRQRLQRSGRGPTAPLVDFLLRGIMASRSDLVILQLYFCCSPNTVREFVERFPRLERLDVEGKGEGQILAGLRGAPGYDDFASEVARIVGTTGAIPALRHLGIDSTVGTPSFVRLLCAAQRSTNLEAIRFSVDARSRELVEDVFYFGADACPPALKKLAVNTVWSDENDELLDISPFFNARGTSASLSPSILEVTFHRCRIGSRDDCAWVDRAVTALKSVERLSVIRCVFQIAGLLEGLPRLRAFACLLRYELEGPEMDDDFLGSFDEELESPYVLDTNDALAGLCRVIKRPTCQLDDVELDVIERPTSDDVELDVIERPTAVVGGHRGDELTPFTAIADLFEHSKGRLHIGDRHFASFLQALRSNKSLKVSARPSCRSTPFVAS